VISDTQATGVIGAGATGSGFVTLTTPGGTASSPTGFAVGAATAPVAVESSIVQTISATKTLTTTSEIWQFLTPSTSDRDVVLPTSPTANLKFWIVNQSAGTIGLVLKETAGGTAIVTLKNAGDKQRAVQCYYDGATWNVFEESYYA
jgi:hypothetical protein